MPAPLTILHATDLHLRRHLPGSSGHAVRRSREIPGLLERLGAVIAERRPDLLVLTGDLVDVPHPFLHGDAAAYPEMMAESIDDYRVLRAWLDGLHCPWQVVPGNHDRLDAFAQVFGEDRTVERRLGGFRIVGFEDWEVEANQAQRIGVARERFERVLGDDDPSPQVHLQHYLIRPTVDYRYPLMYREAAQLGSEIEASGRVQAVLSGHWHKGEAPVTVGGTTYSVCPTFCEWPHRYRVVTLHPGTTEVETLALDAGTDRTRRGGAFIGLDQLVIGDDWSRLAEGAAPLLRVATAEERLPVVVAPWHPDRQGWRAAQAMADTIARAARAFAAELDAAYFIVPDDLDPATRARLPAEGAPSAADLFPHARHELGVDLSRSVLAGGGERLAAIAREHGVRPLSTLNQ
ncbi:3',5'-cyclic AMP phosphodiesterase CpdA [Stella humosa]|uniref:3',5'-cyclic AMP phosphodiesterase CpdA n=1 Tax=Stella humosa TaxID=94 RepID=A0A3N1LWN1_9PROT|nr:3',5'-cyclic AMP phosphodiesterase CpdA [Stella humosa]BBK31192.1 hypothetical protein STHU_18260 [Stella humosa]